MKKFKRLFSVVMVLAVLFGANASFAKVDVQAAEAPKKSIISIDAGRKYFSDDQLKAIIERAHNNGYTDVQILLANDATRFFLDDMTIEANGKVYASDDVKAALEAGNATYYADPNGDHLTEAEMDEVLAYAEHLGMGIIPGINSPGHMDSILVAMEELGIENPAFDGSKRTVDVTNKEAVAFTQALVAKYVDYFSQSSSVNYFNFGCDEYANDVDTGGWQKLQTSGLYTEFVNYVNGLASIIKEDGLRPICFNDGLYYRGSKINGEQVYDESTFGRFDEDIVISFWTAGWSGFDVAKPEYFLEKGHDILNTNDGWYWVLGNYTSTDGIYDFASVKERIDTAKIGFNEVPAAATKDIETLGSVQGIWCDTPSKAHDIDSILTLMDAYSTTYRDYMPLPADYTKVDEALAKVPADLSVYTNKSVAVLQTAIDAVERGLRVYDQEVVDGYTQAIETAITGLQKRADYTKVDEALAKVPADLSVYTDESVAALQTAIDAVDRDLSVDEQATVDGYAESIEKAIENLQKKPEATTPGEDGTTPGAGNGGANAATGIEENNAAATVVAVVGLCAIAAAGVVLLVVRRRATK